ncbi:hypothetical protein XENTR_v10010853 [Xenopus tropicalis]|nr:hypothetical protein XENTR_v10010839 [Xenopus tropicalis]KAE8606753.1 hypothetical protein XENTR_v10010853 [Xenopus tropicalis]
MATCGLLFTAHSYTGLIHLPKAMCITRCGQSHSAKGKVSVELFALQQPPLSPVMYCTLKTTVKLVLLTIFISP